MDDRDGLAVAAALGEAAFEVALRGAAVLLATGVVAAMLMGMAFVSSVIEASQPPPAAGDILLMPAKMDGRTM